MNKEEAIKAIQDFIGWFFIGWFKTDSRLYKALEMAIQALSQEPCDDATLKDIFCMGCEYREQEPCEDAISRDAVIKIIEDAETARLRGDIDLLYAPILKKLNELTSVNPQPCDDAISRILKRMWNCRGKHTTSIDKVKMEQIIREELSSVTKKTLECNDTVSRGVFEQVMRERDIAIEQLHELGYELGQKIEPLEVEAAKLQQAYNKGFEDCRQAAIEAVKQAIYNHDSAIMRLTELPPVTQKSGHWIEMDGYDGDVYYDCSECGESWTTIEGTPWDNGMKYCPNCGAKMESEEQE